MTFQAIHDNNPQKLISRFHELNDCFEISPYQRKIELHFEMMELRTQLQKMVDIISKFPELKQTYLNPLQQRKIETESQLLKLLWKNQQNELMFPPQRGLLRLVVEQAEPEEMESGKRFIHVVQCHGELVKTAQLLELAFPPEHYHGIFLCQKVIESQLEIIRIIRKIKAIAPNVFIFLECQTESLSGGRNSPSVFISRKLFPQGIPEDFKLNRAQRQHLYYIGGAQLLYDLKEIDALYQSIHNHASEAIDRAIAKGNSSALIVPREREAMSCVKEVFAQNPYIRNPVALMIYGAGHDFTPYCREEGFQHTYEWSLPEFRLVDVQEYLKCHRAFYQKDQEEFVIPQAPKPEQEQEPPPKKSRACAIM